jgi:hypothetical protein
MYRRPAAIPDRCLYHRVRLNAFFMPEGMILFKII